MAITYIDETSKPKSRIEYIDEPSAKPSRLKENISKYGVHPLIEGGAMTIGGAAGAVLGSPAGPAGSFLGGAGLATAMYPPAKQAANAVDRMIGLNPPESTLRQDLTEGAYAEAGGRALPIVAKGVSKIPFSRFGEALTGSPRQNFSRAYQKGLSTYFAPSVEEAGEKFGAERIKLAGDLLSPEEQAAMAVNPSGEAGKRLSSTISRWLRGEQISPSDALAARQAADTIFPADTARKSVQRGTLSDFKSAMNRILSETAPAMKEASDDYASAKLKSNLLQPLRVNKSNPGEPSKLGLMLNGPLAGMLAGHGEFGTAVVGLAAQSPAFMGFVSSVAGQVAKALPNLSPSAKVALARGLFSSFLAQQANSGSPTGGTQ